MAGERPSANGRFVRLDFCLFGQLKRIVNLNTEIANRAFKLGMTKE